MREATWGYAVIVLGVLAIGIIWFFANTTNTDQHNYNLLKETVEASMYDAIDISFYRKNGVIKIEEQKFVENFIRRFAENAELSNIYDIEIYDVNETPPKVSLRVLSSNRTNATGDIINFNIVNNIDAILEAKYITSMCTLDNPCTISVDYISWSDSNQLNGNANWTINIKTLELPSEIKNMYAGQINSKIKSARWKETEITKEDLILRNEMNCEWYNGYYDDGKYYPFTDHNGNCIVNQYSDDYYEQEFKKVANITNAEFILNEKTSEIEVSVSYKNGSNLVNWFTVEWEYWFE